MHILAKSFACILWTLIRGYQILVSPWLPGHCRYYPTCSQYALEAVERYGPIRGVWIAIRRIIRCQPWGSSGIDPVPFRKPTQLEKTCNFHIKCIAPRNPQRYIRPENSNTGHY